MCDIGRFDYRWVEGERRVSQPLARGAQGAQVTVAWKDALVTVGRR